MADTIKLIILFCFSTLFISCGVTIEDRQLEEMLLNYETGILAGVDIGDDWEKVKASHHADWEIREEKKSAITIRQYRKDWDDHDNSMYLGFILDASNKIVEMDLSLRGTGENAVTVRKFMDTTFEKFNAKFTATGTDTWNYASPDGNKCNLRWWSTKDEGDGPPSVSFRISVDIEPS